MAFEPTISPQPAVRPINDADRSRPDGQSKRDGGKRQQSGHHEEAAPIANERGEITGKVINIVA